MRFRLYNIARPVLQSAKKIEFIFPRMSKFMIFLAVYYNI